MILPDINLFLHAYNTEPPAHAAARREVRRPLPSAMSRAVIVCDAGPAQDLRTAIHDGRNPAGQPSRQAE